MSNAMTPIPKELDTEHNQAVLAHLAGASAHGDVAQQMLEACSRLGDCDHYYPDRQNFSYVAVYTRATIFGFATGMGAVAFRLDSALRSRAIETGAGEIPELDEWVAFELFRSDWPSVDLKFWALKAYAQIREHQNA